ncbi:GatB/YqeY domain-containing protein [Acidiferrimicrobium sp. IK]|uniref:GatB/YqeY domain-containing protein n=1 Tax=Acidiferrimicrobium sp. IK TaxID=2871700 RepID=UPI0021CB1BB3|nr:GatB/YqeY domain-containing protein [Acidiferrimicrobium sp. IK]MCU4186814.1 GatB/YqeY domain-containing protein [Acidiferrimicrobium sp. IK]
MLEHQLRDDLTAAMKAQDKLRMSTLRSLRAAIINAQVAGAQKRTLTDEEVTALLQSELKKRAEAAEAFDLGQRPERAASERAEAEIISSYLPQALSDDQLDALVARVVEAGGYHGKADMGAAMRDAKAEAAGRADGRKLAELVQAHLA